MYDTAVSYPETDGAHPSTSGSPRGPLAVFSAPATLPDPDRTPSALRLVFLMVSVGQLANRFSRGSAPTPRHQFLNKKLAQSKP